MSASKSKKYRLVRRVKDEGFSVDDLHEYRLSLMIGTRDFQFCVTNEGNKVLLLEDYKLEGIKTINTRIRVLQEIFDNHHVLSAGFWNSIWVYLKTHKYTLVPVSIFDENASNDYLAVNSEIKPSIETVHKHEHTSCGAVNVFAGDLRLIKWLQSLYPSKQIEVRHQGSALIDGVLSGNTPEEKALYACIDRGVMHILVSESGSLLYYNQFTVKRSEDFLKYTMLVFKELGLNQRKSPVTIWGHLKEDSKHTALLKKYIKNVTYGTRPNEIKLGYQFDELLDHQYFDLFNTCLYG